MTDSRQRHLLCFGFGYCAKYLAEILLEQGFRVSGTHRNMMDCENDRNLGITSYIFDQDLPIENMWDINTVTHILISIPPQNSQDIVLKEHLADLKKMPKLEWVGYLSTTGVYGDKQGDWVDENSVCSPTTERTIARLNAEKEWLGTDLPVNIFRLSGIYGPNNSIIEQLKNGTAKRINKPGQFFSRIHVADIANTLIASMNKNTKNEIFNIADDYPCSQEEVVAYAAQLLNLPAPPLVDFKDAELSEMAKSFYAQNRQVKNDKIKNELGVELLYPSYKEGLFDLVNKI